MNKSAITQWPCPAKINLFLHFVGQRENGYHNLQSVFQLLDFGDQLDIEIVDDNQIIFSCDQPDLANADNLVVRAAHKIVAAARHKGINKSLGAKIHLLKRLPAGGGIGGGSSDCATTLIALNHLWDLSLSLDELAQIGLQLGADVPIFVHGVTAFVEGIGEIITKIETPEIWYLVVFPGCHVSTQKIFSNPLLTRNSKAIKIRDLNALDLPYQGTNSMQTIVCSNYPEVDSALKWLKQVNPYSRMTGSGSCLFAPFDNEQEVRKIASRCEWAHFVAKAVNQSPLQQKLTQSIKMQNKFNP